MTIRRVKPLSSLEGMLRSSFNNSLKSMAEIGEKTITEKEKIEELEGIYEQAVEEDWDVKGFLDFIEDNTDLSFIIDSPGENSESGYDFKELAGYIDSMSSPKHQKKAKKDYQTWM